MTEITLSLEDINNLAKKILLFNGCDEENASILSNTIMRAERDGSLSHGLFRLPAYVAALKSKKVNGKARPEIKKISPSIIKILGNNAFAPMVLKIGLPELIKLAKETGVAVLAITNSHHMAAMWPETEAIAEEGLVGFACTSYKPMVAPAGAKKALFGTNPICFGSPSGNKIPFILDTSVSIINRGKIRRAEKLGHNIPFGVALDKYGNPTRNAKKALKGVQLPISGFKGSGLAWMVDIVSGVMTGANHGGKVKDPFDDLTGPQNVGHLFIVIKPSIFVGKNYFSQIKKNIKTVKRLPKSNKIKQILYPGERKYANYRKNIKKSIVIPKNILEEIKELNAIK